MASKRIWVLLCSRTGDNNQVLALARSLGQPFQTIELNYNWLRRLGLRLGPTFLTLDRSSRQALRPPWPDLVIAIGRWSVPVVRAIKAASGGGTRTVFLGNPRVSPAHFDLVFATHDYLQPRGPNVHVMALPLASAPVATDSPQADWAQGLPHPRTLLLVGGSIKYWTLTPQIVAGTVDTLARRANAAGGSLLVAASPRTPRPVWHAAAGALGGADHGWVATQRKGGIASFLAAADEIMVTGDSMAMVAEAVLTGKPVGVVPLALDRKGRRKLGSEARAEGSASRRRDMRRFWTHLVDNGLAGTIAEPRASKAASSAAAAALLVAASLGSAERPANAASEPPAAIDLAPIGKAARAALSSWSVLEGLLDDAQRDAGVLWLATWDPQTPWYAKLVAGISSLSALSPVDLTPDVIPVIGYMDDLLLLTIGMFLTARLIPKPVLADLRRRAATGEVAFARRGGMVVFAMWAAAAGGAIGRALGWL